MTYHQLTLANSIIVDGLQIAVRTDDGTLCKRVSHRQFAVPIGEGEEVFFWLVVKPLTQDVSVRIGLNGIMSQQGWVFETNQIGQVDHQAGGDKGRFMVSRRRSNADLVDAYAEAGITGKLAEIELLWRFLQPDYRSSYGRNDDVLGGRGITTRGGGSRSLESYSSGMRSMSSKGFESYEEAIVGTGGESEMNTIQVNRNTDETQPVISFNFELIAVPRRSAMRVPNTRPAEQQSFSW